MENVPPTSRLPTMLPRPTSSPIKAPDASSGPAPPMPPAPGFRPTSAASATRPLAASTNLGPKRKAVEPPVGAATAKRPTPPPTVRRPPGSSTISGGVAKRVPASSLTMSIREVRATRPLSAGSSASSTSSSAGAGAGAARRAVGALAALTSRGPTTATRAPVGRTASGSSTGRSVVGRRGVAEEPASASAHVEEHNSRIKNVEQQIGSMVELLNQERKTVQELSSNQSNLQTQLSLAKAAETSANRELRESNDELLREKALWARDAADLDRERRDRIRLEVEVQSLQAERSRLLRDSEDLDRERRTRQNLERELEEGRDEIRRERKEGRDREEELRREVTRIGREEKERSEELELERDGRKRERAEIEALKSKLSEITTSTLAQSTQLAALQAQYSALTQELASSQSSFSSLSSTTALQLQDAQRELLEAKQKVREAETERRRLHNIIQELKGNIRVFCRVRPPGASDSVARISYAKGEEGQSQITIHQSSESAMGEVRDQAIPFSFDKVFEPKATQEEVFEEIEGLTQSVLDGYNCCIFAFGQTGAGKSHTMEGGQTPESAGMIPRAIEHIFTSTAALREQGWSYEFEGQYLEIYNEQVNDLLGSGEIDKKKHEIKHEKVGKVMRTTVTDAAIVKIKGPNQVRGLLDKAKSRRAVAATLMNERSSRSHSVFSLRVMGSNSLTGESCEGVLNLVDLAGSERLASSGAGDNKDRLKETININKSLSALSDVIGALGQGGQGNHVPYRNSKLTYLLQTSLSGQSKTLMVLNISPEVAHLGESLCSLRFATKVNSTQIGTAKKQSTK